LNVDENQATSANYGVRSIPTLICFRKGEKIGEIIGALPKDMLKEKIEHIFTE
jgi:thioredoxin 1